MAVSRFEYVNGQLFCEGVDLAEVAGAEGTPSYVYSLGTVEENFRQIDAALADIDHVVCYALKANSNVALVRRLAKLGSGADAVSGGEIAIALEAGVPPEKIVFAGVGKRDTEIRLAVDRGILALNVESLQELEVVGQVAEKLGKVARVGMRLNPGVDIEGHPYLTTGRAVDKFGIQWEHGLEAFRYAAKHRYLEPVAVHCHVGSMIDKVDPYVRTAKKIAELLAKLGKEGIRIEHVDIGGGLGVDYSRVLSAHGDVFGFDPREIAENVWPILAPHVSKLVFEPGRAIVASAGVLLTRVLYVKETLGKRFVVVDAAMNDLIRPALYGAKHVVLPVAPRTGSLWKVDVVGPICESGDFLAKDVELPPVERGDWLAVMTAGAYGYVLSSNYNARPRAAEILVEGDTYRVVRERETSVWGVETWV